MRMSRFMQALANLEATAEEIQSKHPEFALRIRADVEGIVLVLPGLSITQAAEELDIPYASVRSLLRAHLLLEPKELARSSSTRPYRWVSPQSLLAIMPSVQEWIAKGSEGSLDDFVNNWPERQRLVVNSASQVSAERPVGGELIT